MSFKTRHIVLALAALLVLGLMTSPVVRADDEDDDGVPRGTQEATGDVPQDPKVDMEDGESEEEPDALPEEEESEGPQGLNVKTVFLGNAANDLFLAGEWVEALVSFGSNDETAQYTVRFVAAHINQVGDASAYIQNFTGNAYDRDVNGKETATFKYRFKPHESLDPRDYNLVIRVFFTTSDNNTLAIAAFNNSITIAEPSGTDSETVMTFVTIFGLIGGGVWFYQNKKAKRAPRAAKAAPSSPKAVEMGTGSSFDEAYISADHLRYQESLKPKTKSQSPKRSSSKQ